MKKLIVYIEDDQFDTVRRIAFENAASWSAVIRWCIMSHLKLTEKEIFDEIQRIERNLMNEASGELPDSAKYLEDIIDETTDKHSNSPKSIDENHKI
jgi:hypothetical protein